MSQTFTSDAPTTTTNIFTDNQNSRTNENTLRSNFSGTSYPDNPVAGQKCWRTDKGKEYVYNGTSWIEPDSVSTVGEDVILSYGEMDSLYDRLAVSINDDGSLKTNVTANISEWIIPSWTPTYISSTSFTVSGDFTGVLTANRMIKGVLDSSVVYSYVVSSEYSSTTSLTTVTINDSVLTAELTAIHYSVIQKTTAEGIVNTPKGNISSTNVQGAINELDSEKAALSGATFTGKIVGAVGDSIASAATLDLSTATGQIVHVTGTTTVTAVTMTKGQWITLIWDDILTLTHDATANNLPGKSDITTAAGDRALYHYDGSVVYCVDYREASGLFLLRSGGTMSGAIAMGSNKITGLASGTASGDAVHYGQFAASRNTNGYTKLPNGLILQWGYAGDFVTTSVTFPVAFPSACYSVALSTSKGTGPMPYVKSLSTTTLTIGNVVPTSSTDSATVYGVRWIAIGY